MKATNSLTKAQSAQETSFSAIINSKGTRGMIDRTIGDPQRAAALVGTLISAVNASPKLQECDAGTVVSAALRGEIGMGLSLALGQYSIIPYGSKAGFVINVKGIKQLAVRSCAYSEIDFMDVREGEYAGRDPLTRKPKFNWIEDEDEREAKPIIGYYGYYKLDEAHNNFFQSIYWTHNQILKHADQYSPAFSLERYQKLLNGELSKQEADKLADGSPWYGAPDSLAHRKMCMKTIAKQLLDDGLAPKEVMLAIQADNVQERSTEAVIYADDTVPIVPAVPADEADVIPATAEVVKENTPKQKQEGKAAAPAEVQNIESAEQATIDDFFADGGL